jgi:hypothetical protein
MGFLDKLKRKKERVVEEVKEQTTPEHTTNTNPASSEQAPSPGKRIKRYTSEGKPIYE